MKIADFDTSLTDEQWAVIQPMLPSPAKTGRPPTDRRIVLDAIFYILKGGIQWRLLPEVFPPWKTVHHIFRAWTKNKMWEATNDRLRALVRESEGKKCRPTAAILDSQSVKSDCHGGPVGYDAGKKIKGRKRHVIVDTLGLILTVFVTPADMPERQGAQGLLKPMLGFFTWLKTLWVDGGYSGPAFADWVKTIRPGLNVEVVKRSDPIAGFKILPKRWVVERTFGWLMRNRRLARDYEKTVTSAESWVYIAMIRLQLRRLA
jgi:putative transposase